MPIYAYRCADCGHEKDVLRKLSDPLLTQCPACGKDSFSKQVTAAGFQLKGSGWYVTDFRGGNSNGNGKANNGKGDNAESNAAGANGSDASASKAEGGTVSGGGTTAPASAASSASSSEAAKPATGTSGTSATSGSAA
ncbi:zinc ribbon domain-containing protein [Caballeronia sp. LZ035]|uniref:FmdB family zinc ribbon protein n=1 Tax=Caballeronia sp. LZ035 TaxID=3038568 RepID=UPI002867A350|nr:zinc ribbon domain-containing protein [Caballeronia sp. LZ035]MDR5755923.1 zinc ribbon domain-containing protein [Caballeronia sp. LZ035]